MSRRSNTLIGSVNAVSFLLSLAVLGGGVWLSAKAHNDCEKFLQIPVFAIGGALFLLSIAGFLGACYGVTWLLLLYVCFMFFLILAFFVFTVFVLVVTNKGAGQLVSNRGYKEYRLGDYSTWLQRRVQSPSNWKNIKKCVRGSNACITLRDKIHSKTQFDSRNLSPIESGCCKPPTACGFSYVTPIQWIERSNSTESKPYDCGKWSNEEDVLCYDCDSCKAGVLATLKTRWKEIAIVNGVVLAILVILYSCACCAWRNVRRGYSK